MEPLALAKSLYRKEAEEARGVSAAEFAQRLEERSRRLREMQRETADHLKQAAEDIRASVGKSGAIHEELPEGVAGQAMLGREGSATFDARSLEGEGKVVDRDMSEGVAAHEDFHTKQRAPDAAEVTLTDGTTITDHEFIEAGAIAAQERQSARSVDRLSAEYKAIREKVGALLSPDWLVALSREGKLRQFAAEASLANAA